MSESKPKQKRRLAAIMFSDIVGYSKLMGASEERALRILAAHNKVVGMAINQHEGTVIKQMGDGVLAEFGSAVDSVACALDIQQRVRAYAEKAPPEMRFEVRIGVHLGDVLVVGNDIIGDGVNVASRIEPLAPPGGICISQDVFNQVHNKIEITTVSLGSQQFHNIERQIEIYKVLAKAAEVSAAGGSPASVPAGGDAPVGKLSVARSSRRTLWLGIGIGVAAVVALLIVGGMIKEGKRRKAEDIAITQALNQAQTHVDAGRYADARAALDDVIAEVRPGTPGLDQVERAKMLIERRQSIDTSIEQAKALAADANYAGARSNIEALLADLGPDADRAAELRDALTRIDHAERITARYRALVDNLYERDWPACAAIIAPESRQRIGMQGLLGRFRIIRLVVGAIKLEPEHLRLRDLKFSDDLDSATARMELFVDGDWKPANQLDQWQRVGGEWYLIFK